MGYATNVRLTKNRNIEMHNKTKERKRDPAEHCQARPKSPHQRRLTSCHATLRSRKVTRQFKFATTAPFTRCRYNQYRNVEQSVHKITIVKLIVVKRKQKHTSLSKPTTL